MEQSFRGRRLFARHCGLLWRVLLVCVLVPWLGWIGTYPVSAQSGSVYTVRAGDSLIRIAARYGLSASQLAAANGLQWNSWVYVGQRLTIPGQGSSVDPTTGTGTYVVQAGDTLVSIAARHGLTVSQLASLNGLGANAWVYIGQRLKVSGSASTPTQPTQTAPTATGTYIVRPGDTLIGIAMRHGVTVSRLAAANGLYATSWVYSGQQLKIPGQSSTPVTSPPSTDGTYTVRPGDTLISIAARHGVSVSHLAAANGLYVSAWVYTGQRLKIPGPASAPAAPAPTPAAPNPTPAASQPSGSGKWIDVNLTAQSLIAYEGQTAVFQTKVSTGIWQYPTVVGTFQVYVKYAATRMTGPGYNLPNVPWTMYFYRGYAIHGTYWHSNFGTPMSHGCVNLSIPDAKWVYDWAPVGTKVVTHY